MTYEDYYEERNPRKDFKEHFEKREESYAKMGDVDGLKTCPKCGGDGFTEGTDIADYCIDCKTIFMSEAKEWTMDEVLDDI